MGDTVSQRTDYFATHYLPYIVGFLLLLALLVAVAHWWNYNRCSCRRRADPTGSGNNTIFYRLENTPGSPPRFVDV